jgi:hypothetical protein
MKMQFCFTDGSDKIFNITEEDHQMIEENRDTNWVTFGDFNINLANVKYYNFLD